MLNSRKLEDLHPHVRQCYEAALKEIESKGIKVLVVSTKRDAEYQAQLYAQGRTDMSKPIVTKVKLIGAHGFGIALDVVPMVNGECAWNRGDLYDIIANVMKKHGFKWGGDWKSFIDKPHFEMTEGFTGEQLRSGKYPSFWNKKEEPKEAKPMDKDQVSPWAKEAQSFVMKNGISDGTAPKDLVTREQTWMMIQKLYNQFKKEGAK